MNLRPATPGDRAALIAMFERCSKDTRYRRFHGFLRAFPERYLADALSGRPGHIALVAEVAGRIVALGSCADDEIGILVEDEFQRQGIGTRMLTALTQLSGPGMLLATIQSDQAWILSLLRHFGNIKIDWA
ncbi:MAG TPA: GNAT family N-acetyltransferase [Streptosporangiaceae bacterium]|nr:GNAT family N-acetyltransferase [Streptosporangiaceae bacterium]